MKTYNEAMAEAMRLIKEGKLSADIAVIMFPEIKETEEWIKKEIQAYFCEKTGYRSRWFHWVSRATAKPALLSLKPIKDGEMVIGVNIPLINKSLLFSDISEEGMEWEKAVKYAEGLGKELPAKDELYILQYFREQIAEYWPKFKDLTIWSSTQSSAYYAWRVLDYGVVDYATKYYELTAVPLTKPIPLNS